MNDILKLKPFYSEKIWGYEEWTLSTHKNGGSKVDGSDKSLVEVLNKELPILIKTIQANDTLSVQVHPDNEYARKFENDNGKTECWYILEAKKNASLICGIKKGIDKEKLSRKIEEGKIEESLEKISVEKGDMIYIPSGTVHAIEGGLKIIEIQQSSDITYRMYDWGRDREMHIKKALDVIDYKMENECGKIENFKKLETPYFTVEKIDIDGVYKDKVNIEFCSYTVIDGNGVIKSSKNKVKVNLGETVYINTGIEHEIHGKLKLIKSCI